MTMYVVANEEGYVTSVVNEAIFLALHGRGKVGSYKTVGNEQTESIKALLEPEKNDGERLRIEEIVDKK